ncbi:PBECR4 domain-containing protein [Atopococcus tabaci]|uniref:PBECR4 domain-containing protein n=1 Tax=Atopococcus tabaci TaxID=269774 RepID=UPI0003FAE7CF|nr:PBECR4 domain-containing protein [Atopococcus tabaci]
MDQANQISVTPLLKIRGLSDINYYNLLEDYKKHFCGNLVTFETNYKLLESFDVFFEPKQLPHLLGWDKILSSKMGAGKIIKLVEGEKITLESTRKHHRFPEARKRMENYNFLHEIFIHTSQKVCIMTRDMKPNSMKLDIVFYKEDEKEATILGLRKDYRMDYFVPTTLHTKSLNNQFSRRKRTSIKKVIWNNTEEEVHDEKGESKVHVEVGKEVIEVQAK